MYPQPLTACEACGRSLLPLDDHGSAGCPRCCEELLVIPRFDGVREYRTFPAGAVFGGGIAIVDPAGERSLTSPPSVGWHIPLAVGVLAVGVAAVAWFVGGWIAGAVGLVVALPIIIGVAISGAADRRRVLTFDLARGVCIIENAGRVTFRAPLRAVHGIAIRVVAPPSYSDCFEVLVVFERARMRVTQTDQEAEAIRLARGLAERTGIRHDATIERESPHG